MPNVIYVNRCFLPFYSVNINRTYLGTINKGDIVKYIWCGIILMTMHTVLGKSLNDEQSVSGELRLTFKEQTPSAILEKCTNVSKEPILTPAGVINPFAECVKGSSEMHRYVSLEDQQKPIEPEISPIVQEEIQQLEGTFDSNSADPYELTEELREDEMKEFLQMVENENQNQAVN